MPYLYKKENIYYIPGHIRIDKTDYVRELPPPVMKVNNKEIYEEMRVIRKIEKELK